MENIAGAGETIFALSSGGVPSGVALIRLSGSRAKDIVRLYGGAVPAPRRASMRTLRLPDTGEIVDQGLVLWFPGPDSFTGEDSAFIGKIDPRLDHGAQLDQCTAPRLGDAEQAATRLIQCLPTLCIRLRIDQIGKTLNRCQVKLAVIESPSSELPQLCHSAIRLFR